MQFWVNRWFDQITDLLKIARNNDLLIHPYTFRADRLPSYTSSFDELLDLFFQEVGVDGIFTDYPDQAVRYFKKNSSNWNEVLNSLKL